MLFSLYEKAIQNKKELNEYFEKITSQINLDKVKEEYKFKKFSKEVQDKTFASVDGSYNKSKYLAYFTFAVCSQSIILSPTQENIIKDSEASEIKNISTNYMRNIDKILSQHMQILEIKSTINSLKKHEIDYFLMDGSLRGNLNHLQIPENIDDIIKTYLISQSRKFKKELEEENIELVIKTLEKEEELLNNVDKLIKEHDLEYETRDVEMDVLNYFEVLEYLECVNYLMNNFSDRIICISKTSNTNNLFEEFIPDLAVLEYCTDKAGYTQPRSIKQSSLIRTFETKNRKNNIRQINYPIYNERIIEYEYLTLFTRLDVRGNILKIEIPKVKNQEINVETILEELYSISMDGYPYILKKAHDEVVIKNKNMNRLIEITGIRERREREMLK